MQITGGCHCGAITYQADIDPQKVLICHCHDCQVLSGSAFRTVVMSTPDGMTFTKGKAKEYIKTAESGNQRAQGFCEACGSALYATAVATESRVYGIRLGTVHQRDQLIPTAQIWCRSAQTWLPQITTIKGFETTPQG